MSFGMAPSTESIYEPLLSRPPIFLEIVKNTSAAVARTESDTTDPISMSAPFGEAHCKGCACLEASHRCENQRRCC